MGFVHELGGVCRELRERAGLEVRRDMEFFARSDYRTLQSFEDGGKPTRNVDQLLAGYAQALQMRESDICQMALDRLRIAEGQQGEVTEQVLGGIAKAVQRAPAKPAGKRPAGRSRGAAS